MGKCRSEAEWNRAERRHLPFRLVLLWVNDRLGGVDEKGIFGPIYIYIYILFFYTLGIFFIWTFYRNLNLLRKQPTIITLLVTLASKKQRVPTNQGPMATLETSAVALNDAKGRRWRQTTASAAFFWAASQRRRLNAFSDCQNDASPSGQSPRRCVTDITA